MIRFLLKVGDYVIMDMDKRSREERSGNWSPNGTVGKIVSKHRYNQYIERMSSYSDKEPGVYARDGACQVLWADKKEPETECYNLAPFDPVAWAKYEQEVWHTPRDNGVDIGKLEDAARNTVRIGDLPEHKFYEWDIVRITEPGYGQGWAKILSVLYHLFDQHPMGQKDCPHYNVQFLDNNFQPRGGTSYVNETMMEEGERGPTWCEFHNEPYAFKNDIEQASYEKARGRYTEVRNPYSGENNYRWSIEEAGRALHHDIGDAVLNLDVPFGLCKALSVHRFHNRELGERLRQMALPGFPQRKTKQPA